MVSMVMKVGMVGSISEAADNRGIRPESILASLNTEMAEGDGWSHLTEIALDIRLVSDMLGPGPTEGLIEYRCLRALRRPHLCNRIALAIQLSI